MEFYQNAVRDFALFYKTGVFIAQRDSQNLGLAGMQANYVGGIAYAMIGE